MSIRARVFCAFYFLSIISDFLSNETMTPKMCIFETLAYAVSKTNQANFVSTSLKLHNQHDPIGVLHKLRWQDYTFLEHLSPCVDTFYLINVDQKSTFLDPTHLLTSSCKRSLWTTPNGHGHSTKFSGQDSISQVVNSIKIHGKKIKV